MLELDVQALSLVIGTVIPLLVGFVTKSAASSGLKAVMNALLSALAGGLAVAITANGVISWEDLAVAMVSTFVASTAAYFGVWKPTGVSATVQEKTAGFGLGGPTLETSDKRP